MRKENEEYCLMLLAIWLAVSLVAYRRAPKLTAAPPSVRRWLGNGVDAGTDACAISRVRVPQRSS